MTPAPRTSLFLAVLLVAALPLAGCGNKGPLILAPGPSEAMPIPDPTNTPAETAAENAEQRAADAAAAAAASTVVLPAPASTFMPPSPATIAPPPSSEPDSDGTSGTPR
jgi:predicted small lipoprotein YifL